MPGGLDFNIRYETRLCKVKGELGLFHCWEHWTNSPNCFGTADAICFRKNVLRIHDLKTGEVPAHMEQLMVYAALFCLEYRYKPSEIEMELRIYQHDQVLYHNPTVTDILPIMDKIVTADKIIEKMREEEE